MLALAFSFVYVVCLLSQRPNVVKMGEEDEEGVVTTTTTMTT